MRRATSAPRSPSTRAVSSTRASGMWESTSLQPEEHGRARQGAAVGARRAVGADQARAQTDHGAIAARVAGGVLEAETAALREPQDHGALGPEALRGETVDEGSDGAERARQSGLVVRERRQERVGIPAAARRLRGHVVQVGKGQHVDERQDALGRGAAPVQHDHGAGGARKRGARGERAQGPGARCGGCHAAGTSGGSAASIPCGAARGRPAASARFRGSRPARPRRSPGVGGDLEHDAARLVEIDGAEVLAVLWPVSCRRWWLASFCAISACSASSGARKAMWCTEPRPMRPGRNPLASRMSTTPPTVLSVAIADIAVLTPRLREAQHVGQHRAGRRRLVQHQGDAVEAADGMLGRDLPVAPGRSAFEPATPTSARPMPSGSLKASTGSPKRRAALVPHALLDERWVQ